MASRNNAPKRSRDEDDDGEQHDSQLVVPAAQPASREGDDRIVTQAVKDYLSALFDLTVTNELCAALWPDMACNTRGEHHMYVKFRDSCDGDKLAWIAAMDNGGTFHPLCVYLRMRSLGSRQ